MPCITRQALGEGSATKGGIRLQANRMYVCVASGSSNEKPQKGWEREERRGDEIRPAPPDHRTTASRSEFFLLLLLRLGKLVGWGSCWDCFKAGERGRQNSSFCGDTYKSDPFEKSREQALRSSSGSFWIVLKVGKSTFCA